MLTTKEIINSITSISTYFKTLFFLGFIWLVSLAISKLTQIPINYVWFAVVFALALIGTYLATSPLLIDYKDILGKMVNNTRIMQAELKKEQAKSEMILADLNSLEAIYETEKAAAKQIVKELSEMRIRLSEIENEQSELQSIESKELAMYKQEVSKLKDYLSKVQSENNQNAVRIAKLQKVEPFLFLVELDLTPQQVKKGLANTFNGLMNGKTETEKERIRQIINTKTIQV